MKVYAVLICRENDSSWYFIEGVYFSKERAEEKAELLKKMYAEYEPKRKVTVGAWRVSE